MTTIEIFYWKFHYTCLGVRLKAHTTAHYSSVFTYYYLLTLEKHEWLILRHFGGFLQSRIFEHFADIFLSLKCSMFLNSFDPSWKKILAVKLFPLFLKNQMFCFPFPPILFQSIHFYSFCCLTYLLYQLTKGPDYFSASFWVYSTVKIHNTNTTLCSRKSLNTYNDDWLILFTIFMVQRYHQSDFIFQAQDFNWKFAFNSAWAENPNINKVKKAHDLHPFNKNCCMESFCRCLPR